MRLPIGFAVLVLLCGCTRDIDFSRMTVPDGDVIIARPTSRLVTERVRFDKQIVLCSEPSPDVAAALARSGSVAASGSVPQGPTINANASLNSSETLTELKGRTAGVIALRDGLYFACQAYASGVIGQNSYAIILSQYGRLLNQLVGTAAPTTPATTTVAAGMEAAATRTIDLLMLVSCIDESDPTRFPAGGAERGNRLLAAYCGRVLDTLYPPVASTVGQVPARSLTRSPARSLARSLAR